jgi:hypothetical protein
MNNFGRAGLDIYLILDFKENVSSCGVIPSHIETHTASADTQIATRRTSADVHVGTSRTSADLCFMVPAHEFPNLLVLFGRWQDPGQIPSQT